MLRAILRAKIHKATVTASELEYEGSITIDAKLLKAAGILPYEQVVVSNLNNGERFVTYALSGKSGEICLNGPTARKGQKGDKVIVFSYGYVEDSKLTKPIKPILIYVDAKNKITEKKTG